MSDRHLAHSKKRAVREEKITAERLTAFSDAVFAVIVTIMVLELRAPDQPAFSALWPLWPTAVSYAVSYLFIATIWINHHHLMRFVGPPTLGLIWINFVHLFMMSLLPFCDRMDCAHPAHLIPCGVLLRTVRLHRHCLQRLRARSISLRRHHAGVPAYADYGEAPITRCPCGLHERYVGCDRRAPPRTSV